MSKFLRQDDDAKAIVIPRVFSENSRAKNGVSDKATNYMNKLASLKKKPGEVSITFFK